MANQPLLRNEPRKLEFGEITQKPLRRSRSFKVTDFGINWKPICDFLLVKNTNLHLILHRFQVMADYWSNFRYSDRGVSHFKRTPLLGVIPANVRINFTFSETRMIVLRAVEDRAILLFTHLDKTPERDGRTDGRQTDGQTDSPWLLQRSALRAMRTRCKTSYPSKLH